MAHLQNPMVFLGFVRMRVQNHEFPQAGMTAIATSRPSPTHHPDPPRLSWVVMLKGCAGSINLRAPGYPGARVSRYTGARAGTRAPGYSGARASGYPGTRAPGYFGTRALGHSNTRIPGHPSAPAPGYLGS